MDKRILVLLIVWSGCLDAPGEVTYEELLNTVVHEGIPGVILLVRTPDYEFVGAQGFAHTEESILMSEHQLFRIASTVVIVWLAAACVKRIAGERKIFTSPHVNVRITAWVACGVLEKPSLKASQGGRPR